MIRPIDQPAPQTTSDDPPCADAELAELARSVEDAEVCGPTLYCRHCRYPLDGLDSERCPECGRPFSERSALTEDRPGVWRGRLTTLLLGFVPLVVLMFAFEWALAGLIIAAIGGLAVGAVTAYTLRFPGRRRRGRRLPRMRKPWFSPGYTPPDD